MVYNIPIFVSQHQETTAFLKEEQFVNRRQISCELFTIYFTAVNSFYWGKNIIEIKSFPQWGFHGQFMGLVKCWLIYFNKQMTDNKRECHNFKCSFYSKFSNFPYDPACPSVGLSVGWSVCPLVVSSFFMFCLVTYFWRKAQAIFSTPSPPSPTYRIKPVKAIQT